METAAQKRYRLAYAKCNTYGNTEANVKEWLAAKQALEAEKR